MLLGIVVFIPKKTKEISVPKLIKTKEENRTIKKRKKISPKKLLFKKDIPNTLFVFF